MTNENSHSQAEVAADMMDQSDIVRETDLHDAKLLYDKLMAGTVSLDAVCSSDVISRIRGEIQARKESLQSRTALLRKHGHDICSLYVFGKGS